MRLVWIKRLSGRLVPTETLLEGTEQTGGLRLWRDFQGRTGSPFRRTASERRVFCRGAAFLKTKGPEGEECSEESEGPDVRKGRNGRKVAAGAGARPLGAGLSVLFLQTGYAAGDRFSPRVKGGRTRLLERKTEHKASPCVKGTSRRTKTGRESALRFAPYEGTIFRGLKLPVELPLLAARRKNFPRRTGKGGQARDWVRWPSDLRQNLHQDWL